MDTQNTKLEIQINKQGQIYSHLREKWLENQPEELVRQNYVCKLVNDYGYSLEQMGEELKVSNSNRGQGKARADIVIWRTKEDKINNANAFIVVECKAESITIQEQDYYQGANYASWSNARFFVTTNNKETKFFRINPTKLPTELDEIIDIPQAKDANNNSKIQEMLNSLKIFEKDEFATLLRTCHDIIRNNDKLSPESAFDEISKILFMKIMYERRPEGGAIFSKEEFKKQEDNYEKNIRPSLRSQEDNISYMQHLFKQTKDQFKEDKIFEDYEQINIRQISFEQIIEKLQKYNLSNTSDDVKGIAFERFLGTTFRGELGQFFTPRPVVNFMSELLDPKFGETICDPTCGSGGFLIKAFEHIKEQLEKEYKDEELKEKIKHLSQKSIYGTDANPRMARVSKMNMIMHGDGHNGVHRNDGLLNVNGIFENRFDVILTNPPFGTQIGKTHKITKDDVYEDEEMIKKYTQEYGEEYERAQKQVTVGGNLLDKFETGKMSGKTEVIFIERCLNLLKKGGRMGIVLPEGVLNNDNLQKVRNFVESKAKILLIVSIPQDVFISSGATVKSSLLFLKKFTKEEEEQYEKIKTEALKTLEEKYKEQKQTLENECLKKKITKTEKNKELKKINEKIDKETLEIIKENFNYKVPIAEVEKAGITTTGQMGENNLPDLLKEFQEYQKQNNLW